MYLISDVNIFLLILGILFIPVMFYLFATFFGLIFGGISKLSGKTLVRHGQVVSDPDSFDNIVDDLKAKKDLAVKAFNSSKSFVENKFSNIKSKQAISIVNDKTKDKLDKLKAINELKFSGTINNEEFELLKKEIFSQI